MKVPELQSYERKKEKLSQHLHRNLTDAERYLWSKIRLKQVKGHQFYRQKPVGEYVVVFCCPKAKLIVEVDGSGHLVRTTGEYDKARDEYLKNQGLKVLRFNNIDVMKNIEGVVEKIAEEIG